MRSRAKQMFAGIDLRLNDQSAVQASSEERQREYEARWAYGGVSFMGAFDDLLFNEGSNDTAAEFVRSKIRETVRDPALAEALVATLRHRLQAAVRRHRLLRDVQPRRTSRWST